MRLNNMSGLIQSSKLCEGFDWQNVLNVPFNLFWFQTTYSNTGSNLGVAHFLMQILKNKWEMHAQGLFLWLWDFSII